MDSIKIIRLCKRNIGKVVHIPENGEERMYLSKNSYADEHETVVEAALWRDKELNVSSYKTFIRRELDNGRPGRGSIINDGKYHETREDAVQWLEETAQEYGGSPLDWEEREIVEYES